MGIDKRKIFTDIFKRKLLAASFTELAEAVITGTKCSAMSEAEIKISTDKIVSTMIVFYDQRVSDAAIEDIKDKCPLELKKYHNYLTIQEVMVGAGMAMRDKFGEVKYQRVSLKLLTELLGKYESSDMRQRIIKTYNEVRDEYTAHPVNLSPEQEEEICYNHRIKQFEKFKVDGIKSAIITSRDYDYLLAKCVMPDYKQFLQQAAEVISKPIKNQTTISEVIDRTLTNKILHEAKRMAVIKLYTNLNETAISLADYIKQPVEA